MERTYLMLVTSQSRATAALQMRLPRKPLPPQTTSFLLAAAEDIARHLTCDRLKGPQTSHSGLRDGVISQAHVKCLIIIVLLPNSDF